MELRGTVKRVIFTNEESNFYVFVVEDSTDNRRPKKAKGNFLFEKPYPGQEVVLEGEWEQTKYGHTFDAAAFVPGDLDSNDGIQKYLENYVHGVGPVTAKRLVNHFGTDTLDVLSNHPERLEEVSNLNKVQRDNLAKEWAKYNEYREIAIHLLDLDLPNGVVKRIYDEWGTDAVNNVEENPYRLMEIRGVGFVIADRVALALGVEPDSTFRIGACIEYALHNASNGTGHLYLEASELINQVYYLIRRNEVTDFGRKLTTEDVRTALQDLKSRDRIVTDKGKIYLAPLHTYEQRSAELLSTFVGEHDHFRMDLEDFISMYEESHKIQFSTEQRQAIESLKDHKVILLTGLPGTGKTTVTKAIMDLFKKQNLAVQLMSPTGIAAKRLSNVVGEAAATIHRALGYRGEGSEWLYNRNNMLPVDAVIVDEFSMVDQQVMFRMLSALKKETILVFVGDHAQLPSVGAGNVLHELIRSGQIARTQLTQIFRQEEASDIILNAHSINRGEDPRVGDPTDPKTDFRFIPRDSDEEIVDGILRVIQGLQAKVDKDATFQVLSPRWKSDLGVNNLNQRIREVLNPLENQRETTLRGGLRLREGDRIIVTANDYEKGVYNGEIGTITEIDSKNSQIKIRIRDFGKTKLIPIEFKEAPDMLNLAFCITIHKSQGMEYDYVVMPFVKGFSIQLQRNLLYTAVTRAKRKVFIFGDWEAIQKAVRNDEVAKRNTLLAERLAESMDELDS